jgi:uncharacterized membrane protein YdbT with pleckstrin-like domain
VAYVDSVLQNGETVKAVGRLHWIIFGRAILLGILAFVVFALSAPLLSEETKRFVTLVGWALLALAILAFLQAWFRRAITELAVTTHRVIYKRGFLSRHTVEMNMDKVETVDVDQSILGRILGFGTIRVRGTGQSLENLSRISSPVRVRNAITAG